MIDLFGIGKAPPEPPEPGAAPKTEPAAPAEPAPPRGSHRVWAALLVLDSLLIIVFAGVAAFKVSQFWRAPAAPVVASRRRPAPKTPEPPKAPEPPKPAEAAKPEPKAEAKPVEAPKPPETAKPAAKKTDSPRPPKPSLLSDGPKPHAAPALAGAAASAPAPAAPAAAPAAEGKAKAQAVVFKLSAPNASSVQLVGAFIVRGGRKEMIKGADGAWTLKLYLNPGAYRYFFSADKKKLLDPENPRTDRGASVMSVP